MKTEAPTEAKLEALRDEGIVSVSPSASHAIALAGSLLILVTLLKKISFQWPSDCYSLPDAACAPYVASLKELGTAFAGTMLGYLVLYLAATLVQTKGFFRFQFTRTHFGDSSGGPTFVAYLLFLVCTFIFLGFSVVTAPKAVVMLLQSMHQSPTAGLIKFLSGRIYIFAAFCGLFGAITWLLASLRFQRMHRMTRAEVLNEGRQ